MGKASKVNHGGSSDDEVKGQLRELDGILPDDLNRRKFLAGSVASIFTAAAGCLGSGNSSGEQGIIKNVIFRTAWEAQPDYAAAYLAVKHDHWSDQNIAPPNVRRGFGSGDTANRVGTRSKDTQFGIAALSASIAAIGEGRDIGIFGSWLPQPQLALIWRKDMVDGPQDLAGETVLTEGAAFGQKVLPIYLEEIGVNPDDVKTRHTEGSVAPSLLNKGEAAALFGYFDDYTVYSESVDAELGIRPMGHDLPILGYPLIVNNGWISESDNKEYTKRVLQGLSQAGKWVMLNPEETVDFMVNEVNPNLEAVERPQLISNLKAGFVAPQLTPEIRDNGLFYLHEETVNNSINKVAKALGVSGLTSESVYRDLNNNAKLATFSSDEWDGLKEFAQPYYDILFPE